MAGAASGPPGGAAEADPLRGGHNCPMSDAVPVSRPLEAWPCRSICVWSADDEVLTDAEHDRLRLFSCRGCGSEWVRTEPWTPIDADGVVPAAIAAERRQVVTTGHDEGGAGSTDT